MPMKAKEMVKLLLANDLVFDRQKGSHAIYVNPETYRIIVVPMHAKELKKGTEQQILKDAGLKGGSEHE